MNTRRFTLSFDKNKGDVPVLVVGREQKNYIAASTELFIERVITGDDAVKVWELLTGKKEAEE